MTRRDPTQPPRIPREPLSGAAVLSICTGVLFLIVAGLGVVFDALGSL